MQTFADRDGLAFTASRPESVDAYDDLVRAFVGFRRDTGKRSEALLADDPEMPMAIAARGYLAKMMGNRQSGNAAAGHAARLGRMAEAGRLNPRERLHASALAAWVAGDMDGADAEWSRILQEQPNDMLALRLAHFIHFYSNSDHRLRDGIARLLPAYGPDHRFYGFVQGMYAFGLEESGDYGRAEKHGRIAVEENPADAWSVHAVAHAMEMTGRAEEGLAFTGGIEHRWSEVNNFRYHLHWHRGLYLLESGQDAEVLALYHAQFGAEPDSGFYLDMLNASSMLWRLELHGLDVGPRWQVLADVAAKRAEDEELIFVSLHYLMALVSAGAQADVSRLMAHLEAWAEKETTQGKVVADVGLALAKGMIALRGGRPVEAFAAMNPVRYDIGPIGGSHAQRDVFRMLLIEAALKAGETGAASLLLAERVAEKPGGVWGWLRYAAALEARGRSVDARAALARGEALTAKSPVLA